MFDGMADRLGYGGGSEAAPDRLLPYVDHVADGVVLLRDGSLLAMARLAGVPFSLTGNAERNAQFRRHVALLNAVSDENVEIHEHFVSHSAVAPLPPRPADVSPYAASLLGDYHASLAGLLYGRDWFIAVRVKPRGQLFGIDASKLPFMRASAIGREEEQADRARQLEEAMRLVMRVLATFGPARLGVREADGVAFSEIMEALYLVRTTRFEPQPLVDPSGSLGAGLYTDRTICGLRGFEIRHAPFGSDSTWGAMLGFRVYPRGRINMRQFDDLLAIDGRFVITSALICQTRAEAQESIALLRRQMMTAGDPSGTGADELLDAIDALASGKSERGKTRWSIAIHGDTMAEVDRLVSQVKTIMANAGAKLAVEGKGTSSSYWSQMIGGPARNWIRPALLDTRQFATLSSLSGFPKGAARPRWGSYLLRLATTGATPFDHDQFVGDVGHLTVIAPNGAGKTVWLGMSIAALDAIVRSRGGTQIVLDVDSSNENTIRALGGVYVGIRAGEDSGIAPLRGLPNTPRVRLMLRQFVAGLTQWDGGPPPTPSERQGIADGVDFVMGEVEPGERRFAMVRKFMGYHDGGAGERFEPWCHGGAAGAGGEFGWAFDGDHHTLDFDTGLVGVDLTAVMNDKTIMPPMASLLLWMASEVMDGRRCVVWAEEAPAYLPEPRFSSMFKGVALRARKRNTSFVAIAQMPEHLLENEAGAAIIKQSRQMVLFANDKAEAVSYCQGLGMSEPEFAMVREGMLALPYRSVLIKRLDGQSSVNRFDLSTLPEHIAVLSGTPRSAALFRSIIAGHPDRAMAENLEEFWRRLPEVAA